MKPFLDDKNSQADFCVRYRPTQVGLCRDLWTIFWKKESMGPEPDTNILKTRRAKSVVFPKPTSNRQNQAKVALLPDTAKIFRGV